MFWRPRLSVSCRGGLLVIGILGLALLSGCVSSRSPAAARAPGLGRGVNVLGYDPIWRSRDHARLQERHFRVIRDGGFDTLRVVLHPFRHMGPAPDHALSASWWQTADWILANARTNDLNVIIDFHQFNELGDDPEGNKAKFLAFWRQVAPRLKDAPPRVRFEILNEPCKKLTPELWNRYLAEALAIIRETNPTRQVVIGPAFWNSVDHLEELNLPEQDRNLVVTVHYYLPFAFTHQGTSWTDLRNKTGVEWLGTPEEKAAVLADFEKVQAWATRNQRPIFLGEFGAYEKADMASRARWTEFIARTAERHGWSWAYWQFDSDFVVYDIKKDRWIEPLHRALIPPSPQEGSPSTRQ